MAAKSQINCLGRDLVKKKNARKESVQSKQHVIAERKSMRKATLEEDFNSFFPSFHSSLFCISGIPFLTDLFFVALSSGMRVVEFVEAEDRKHVMHLIFFLAVLGFAKATLSWSSLLKILDCQGREALEQKVEKEYSGAGILWVMLPASNILFFWLHISLCPEAVSYLAAASMPAPTFPLEQSNILKQGENALIRRA